MKYKTIETDQNDSTSELIPRIDFKPIHDRIVLRQSAEKVVFNEAPFTGYGNRVYSMLSAFLVAVLTESAILISRWPFVNDYMHFKSIQMGLF